MAGMVVITIKHTSFRKELGIKPLQEDIMKTVKTILWTLFAVVVIGLLYMNVIFLRAVATELYVIKMQQVIIYQELQKQKMNFKMSEGYYVLENYPLDSNCRKGTGFYHYGGGR